MQVKPFFVIPNGAYTLRYARLRNKLLRSVLHISSYIKLKFTFISQERHKLTINF